MVVLKIMAFVFFRAFGRHRGDFFRCLTMAELRNEQRLRKFPSTPYTHLWKEDSIRDNRRTNLINFQTTLTSFIHLLTLYWITELLRNGEKRNKYMNAKYMKTELKLTWSLNIFFEWHLLWTKCCCPHKHKIKIRKNSYFAICSSF